VTSRPAIPLATVVSARAVTVPVPLWTKLTTVVLSAVSRLPAASRTATVSVLAAPEATLDVSLVKVRWSAGPT
jgi:hypothetical protein